MNITRTNGGPLTVGTLQYNINIPGLIVTSKLVNARNADEVDSTVIRIIDDGNVLVQIPLSDITQINGVAFAGTAAEAVTAINGLVGQVSGGGGTAGVSQTYVDTAVQNLKTTVDEHALTLADIDTALDEQIDTLAAHDTAISTNAANILLRKPKTQIVELNAFVDFPSVAPATLSAGVTISNGSTSGVTSSDVVTFSPQVMSNGLMVMCKPGSNLITFYAYNPTAAALDPAGTNFKTVVMKPNATVPI